MLCRSKCGKRIKNKIEKEFKINTKIKELEKLFKRPCMVRIYIANKGIFLFGKFVKRRFEIRPLIKNLNKLKGEYQDIDDFCRKARRRGFNIKCWSSVDALLIYKGKYYNFNSGGIYENKGNASFVNNIDIVKVAKIRYALWEKT